MLKKFQFVITYVTVNYKPFLLNLARSFEQKGPLWNVEKCSVLLRIRTLIGILYYVIN